MPVVGLVVMPMAFFAVLLMPFGLESLPLTAMGWGLDWIVLVARTTRRLVAGLGWYPDGAGRGIAPGRRRLPVAGALA